MKNTNLGDSILKRECVVKGPLSPDEYFEQVWLKRFAYPESTGVCGILARACLDWDANKQTVFQAHVLSLAQELKEYNYYYDSPRLAVDCFKNFIIKRAANDY